MPRQRSPVIVDRIILAKRRKIVKDRTKEFLRDEIEEIERYKWIESKKAKHDLGEECCVEWIKKNAAAFREKWEREHGKVVEETEVEDGINCSGCQRQPAGGSQ
jgi:hypothetical protein